MHQRRKDWQASICGIRSVHCQRRIVADIGEAAFRNSIWLNLSLQKTRVIKKHAFENCIELITPGDMPELLTIEEGGFKGCKKLKRVYMPKLLTVGKQAFKNCQMLHMVNGESPHYRGSGVHGHNTSQGSVLPSVETVGKKAFQMGSYLKTVYLPVATTIGAEAFADQPMLKRSRSPPQETSQAMRLIARQ